jgi:hypothetical protein
VESPAGRGRQLDAGARAAAGDTLLFLHADTWLDRGAGDALTVALARPAVVGGCFQLELRGPSAGRRSARLLAWAINARSRVLGTATGDQAIFCRRDAYDHSGGYVSEDLFEDVIFYRRLGRLGELTVVGSAVRTSDRRWRAHGYLRTAATHVGLRLLFLLGVAPDRLARLYNRAS